MSIFINRETCIGCGRCAEICPGNLIQVKEGKAYIKYPKDCWGCASCVKECGKCAISLYLGADMGGMGSRLTVKEEGNRYRWRVEKPDGSKEEILVDRNSSNTY